MDLSPRPDSEMRYTESHTATGIPLHGLQLRDSDGDMGSELESDLSDPPDSDLDMGEPSPSDDMDDDDDMADDTEDDADEDVYDDTDSCSLDDSDLSQDDSLADDPDYDDTVAFGDLDPKTASYDSDDEDCESVIYDREVMEVYNEMIGNETNLPEYTINEPVLSERAVTNPSASKLIVSESVVSEPVVTEPVVRESDVNETAVAKGVIHIEAHPEEHDPFHRYVPSADGQDDCEEDEDTLVNRCDERISKAVKFFHEKAQTVSWQSVKERTAWMNFAFLQPLKRSEPATVTRMVLDLIPGTYERLWAIVLCAENT